MLIVDRLLPAGSPVRGELRLTYAWRQKSRARVQVARGELAGQEVGVNLPRGTVLRDGDIVGDEDGTALRVVAAIEQLLEVRGDDGLHLARIAFHLGNRHVPLQLGADADGGWLRLEIDHVLEQMATGLGARVAIVSRSFDPESGAYGHGGHAHGHGSHDDDRHAPRIHDFTGPAR